MGKTSKKDYPQLVSALKAIYTAPTEATAEQALAELEASALGQRYPADRPHLAGRLAGIRAISDLPAGATPDRLQHESDRSDQRPATEGHPQPGPSGLHLVVTGGSDEHDGWRGGGVQAGRAGFGLLLATSTTLSTVWRRPNPAR
jgi:hypothetical protein